MYNKVICHDIEATKDLAKKISLSLRKKDIVLFYGDLGAGKTFFIKEVCSHLEIPREYITSPTFTIVRTYRSDKNKVFIHHFDLYRMGNAEEVDLFEFEDYLDDNNSIIFIEWADRLGKETFSGRTISITIRITGDFQREFTVNPWIFSE